MSNLPASSVDPNASHEHRQIDLALAVDLSNHSVTNKIPSSSRTTSAPFATMTDARHATFNEVYRDQYITYGNQTSDFKDILTSLKPVEQGGYYVPPCMKGTREMIFEEIDEWVDDVDAPNLLWIGGNPGAGKSAMASSLVSKLIERRRLGSRFFFKRGDVTLGDPAVLWRSMAYDLAQHDPIYAEHLVEALKGRPVLHGMPDVALHFKVLIEEPFTKSYRDSPSHTVPVIIIDALDECDSHTMKRRHLMDTLTQWSRLSKTFKLIVTSRDERFIPEEFRAVCKRMALPTGDGVSAGANEDIRFFFEERFAGLAGSLSPEWPWKRVLDVLTTRAAGLFIWAETVVRFVEQGLPLERLDLVLKGDLGGGDDITKLYRQVLDLSFPHANDRTLEVFKHVVGTIVLAKRPILYEDLQQLVPEYPSSVKFILDKLSTVISIGEIDKRLRIGHLSFREFLCDRQRCPEEFFINRGRESQRLAIACFQLMKDGLKFNICDLESSHLLNKEVNDLAQKIETKIPTALIYSCRSWSAHLRDTMINSDDNGILIKEVDLFLCHRLLFWLEVMSLMNDVAAANIALLTLAACIQVFDKKLAALAQDCSRFVVNFYTPVSTSTPHIYVSALPFSPPECFIAKQYQSKFPNTLSVLSGGDQNWPAMLNIFRGHTDGVSSVAFSSNGRFVVSGSRDCTIRIWDTGTGELITGPLEGHTYAVWSVAFSPDGTRVISGSEDHTIRIWDAGTGELIAGPFEGHTYAVLSVAFSPDGTRVVSGSRDCTIRIWDSRTGELVAGPLRGHTYAVLSVAFSPDGARVVSGSRDCTIRIWDSGNGDLVAGPFEGHTYAVLSVALSPDGAHVASSSEDCTIRIWDTGTGELITGPCKCDAHAVLSVAFSPDSMYVISGSRVCTIRIWDARTGELVATPVNGHKRVPSFAISPDGKRGVSASDDHTICIWDIGIGQMVAYPFGSKTTSASSLAYSQDKQEVVSGTCNAMAHIWDVETGQAVAFGGHTDLVLSVLSSHHDNDVASGLRHVALRIKDVKTGPFTTLSGFLGRDSMREGWIHCSDLICSDTSDSGHLFWVPETCREAVCGTEMLIIAGKRTTRLDLSRFAHGTSWTQCRSSPHPPSITTDNPILSSIPASIERPHFQPNSHPAPSDTNPATVAKPVSNRFPSQSNNPRPSYIRYLENTSFILVGLVAGYCFHTIASKK